MSIVSIVRCSRYEETEVLKAVRQSVDLLGGIRSFVKEGDRVLLKPNLLYGKRPEKAVTTHPSVVKAVIGLVREAGGLPFIGDSPGIGSAIGVAEKAGIRKVADEMGCPIIEFNRPVLSLERRGWIFKQIEVDQAVFEADVLINLPKWKTHGQMFLTLGIKNLFGCIPGARKAMWHLKAGEDPYRFAQILVDLYRILRPQLTRGPCPPWSLAGQPGPPRPRSGRVRPSRHSPESPPHQSRRPRTRVGGGGDSCRG